jgi:hypothetical protein
LKILSAGQDYPKENTFRKKGHKIPATPANAIHSSNFEFDLNIVNLCKKSQLKINN